MRNRRDITGRVLKAGQAIAYGSSSRGSELALYAVIGFTAKRIKAQKLGYTWKGEPHKGVTHLHNACDAFILPMTPAQVQLLTIPNEAYRALDTKCEHCKEGELKLCNDEQNNPVGIGCNSDACGAMFDLTQKIQTEMKGHDFALRP